MNEIDLIKNVVQLPDGTCEGDIWNPGGTYTRGKVDCNQAKAVDFALPEVPIVPPSVSTTVVKASEDAPEKESMFSNPYVKWGGAAILVIAVGAGAYFAFGRKRK